MGNTEPNGSDSTDSGGSKSTASDSGGSDSTGSDWTGSGSGSGLGARAVYSIAVAAELVAVGEQALRLYERKGLVTPARTEKGTRRYSDDDVIVLRRIVVLLADGLNLAGARRVLELEAENEFLRKKLGRLSSHSPDPH